MPTTTQGLSKPVDELRAQTAPPDRITYALDNDEHKGRNFSSNFGILRDRRRSLSRDSMSIRSARRRIDPGVTLPPQFRTLSFGINEGKKRAASFGTDANMKKESATVAEIEFSDIDYHVVSVWTLF